MTLYDRLLRQRAVILVATIGLMLAGVLAVTRLGTGIYPEVEFPRIVVVARASDLPPEEMQAAVVRPLEESLAAVLGLRRLRVRINRGASELALQFADGTDMWRALQLVDAAVSEARPSLPPGVEIETQKVTPADFPILSYNLVGGNATERREVAEQVVRSLVRPGDVVTTTITGAAPHHLIADAPLLTHRRTRAGDAEAAGKRPRTVGLGLPLIGGPPTNEQTNTGCER